MKLAIIILNWNGKSDTKECLSSLSLQSDPDFITLVVDNGSKDASYAELSPLFPDVKWLLLQENQGFAKGNNLGIEYALSLSADTFFLLNNDTVVDVDLIKNLKAFYLSNQQAIIGCQVRNYYDPTYLDHLGGIFNRDQGSFDLIGAHAPIDFADQALPPLDYVTGSSILIPASCIEKIGYLDERFFLVWEEAEFCWRAKKAGIPILFCPKAILYHKVSRSFQSKSHHHYFWWRNRFLFLSLHPECLKNKRLFFFTILAILWKLFRRYSFHLIRFPFSPAKKKELLLTNLAKNRAIIEGLLDFLRNRFGPPPQRLFHQRYGIPFLKKSKNS